MSDAPKMSDSELSVLAAIKSHFENPKARRGPSMQELVDVTGFSHGHVILCVRTLEVRGVVTRRPGKWRSIRLV